MENLPYYESFRINVQIFIFIFAKWQQHQKATQCQNLKKEISISQILIMSSKVSDNCYGNMDEKIAANDATAMVRQKKQSSAVNKSSNVCGQDAFTEEDTARLRILLPRNLKGEISFKPPSSESPFDPWVPDTLANVRSSRVVLVPSKVFFKRPEYISPFFTYDKWVLAFESVNVMMTIPMMQQSDFGVIDPTGHMWKITADTKEDIDDVISRFESRPSVIHAVLIASEVMVDNSELGVVLFLAPQSRCITMVISQLHQAKERLKMKRKYVIDVDLSDTTAQWSNKVLHRKYKCMGAKFRISGGIFSELSPDRTNGSGCFRCFQKRNKVSVCGDVLQKCDDLISVVGSKSATTIKQKLAFIQLMSWVESVPSPLCDLCGKSMMQNGNQECDEIHQIYRHRQIDGSTADDNSDQEETGLSCISPSESEISDCLETIFEVENECESSRMSSMPASRLTHREKTKASLTKQELKIKELELAKEKEQAVMAAAENETKMADEEKYRKWLRNDQLFYLPENSFEKFFKNAGEEKKRQFLGQNDKLAPPEIADVGLSARAKQKIVKQNFKKSLSKSTPSKIKVVPAIGQSSNLPIKAKCLEKEYQIPLQMYFKYAQYGDRRLSKSEETDSLSSRVPVTTKKVNINGAKYAYSPRSSINEQQSSQAIVDGNHSLKDVNEEFFMDVLPRDELNEPAITERIFERHKDVNRETNSKSRENLVSKDDVKENEQQNCVPSTSVNHTPAKKYDHIPKDEVFSPRVNVHRRTSSDNVSITNGTAVPANSPVSVGNSVNYEIMEFFNREKFNESVGCFDEARKEKTARTNSLVSGKDSVRSHGSNDKNINGKTPSVSVKPTGPVSMENNVLSYETQTMHSKEKERYPDTIVSDKNGYEKINNAGNNGERIGNQTKQIGEGDSKELITNKKMITSTFPKPLSSIGLASSHGKVATKLTPNNVIEGNSSTDFSNVFSIVDKTGCTEKTNSTKLKSAVLPGSSTVSQNDDGFTNGNSSRSRRLGVSSEKCTESEDSESSTESSSSSSDRIYSDPNSPSQPPAVTSKSDDVLSPESILRLSRESSKDVPGQGADESERASIQAATRENTWVTSQENSPTTQESPDLSPESEEKTPVPFISATVTIIEKKNRPAENESLQKSETVAPSRRKDAFQEIEVDFSKTTRYSFREGKSSGVSEAETKLTNGVNGIGVTSETKTVLTRPKRPPGFVHPIYRDISDIGDSAIIPNKRFDVVNFLSFKADNYSEDF